MLKRSAVLVLVLANLSCTMWKKAPSGWSGATGGEQLENLFWRDVQAKNWTEVEKHIAPTFAGAGPGGPMNRAAFVVALQRSQLTSFSLTDCSTQLNGADLMITCITRRQGSAGTAATLSVWQQLKKGWVMVAHSETVLAAGQM